MSGNGRGGQPHIYCKVYFVILKVVNKLKNKTIIQAKGTILKKRHNCKCIFFIPSLILADA